MATATKKTNKKGKLPRWTNAEIEMLNEAIAASSTHSAAFKEVGAKLGKSTGTVAQKYYSLQKKGSSKKPRAASRVRRVTAPVVAAPKAKTPEARIASFHERFNRLDAALRDMERMAGIA